MRKLQRAGVAGIIVVGLVVVVPAASLAASHSSSTGRGTLVARKTAAQPAYQQRLSRLSRLLEANRSDLEVALTRLAYGKANS